MIRKITPVLLLISLLLSGCMKDLKRPLESNEIPRIAMYGFVYAGQPSYFMISKTVPVDKYSSFKQGQMKLSSATVRYYANDTLIEEIKVDRIHDRVEYPFGNLTPEDRYFFRRSFYTNPTYAHLYCRSNYIPKEGDRIRVEVSAEELPDASAEFVIPNAPKISEVKVERVEQNPEPILKLSSYEKIYRELYDASAKEYEGRTGEQMPEAPSFWNYVDQDAYMKVSFKLQSPDEDTFYSVGVPKTFHLRAFELDYPITPEGYAHSFADRVLFTMEQVVNVDYCPLFSKKARSIAGQKTDVFDPNAMYFMPYFLSTSRDGELNVQLITPIFKERGDWSLLDENRNLGIFAMSKELATFAERGYEMLMSSDEESIIDMDLSSVLAESQVERSNIQNGVGTIFVASPTYIRLN
ncbi:MAG: DUF4249 family protein [Porphyromonas sp.]|nr:DUF4249 family protein [Porphyromonas sp.]